MKHKVLGIAFIFLLALSSSASAQAVGDLVTLRIATSQYVLAVVGKVVSGSTVNLVAFTDGTTWQDTSDPPNFSTITYYSRTPGTSVGQYQATTIIADTIAAAGFALESYVDTATADLASESYADTGDSARLALPGAPSSAGLTLDGAGVQLSATRPVRLSVRLTASMTSTLLGPQSYTVELRCDSGSTPTTVVDDATGGLSGVAATTVQPAKLDALVPAGHYCRAVTAAASANATLALTASTKQAL